MARAAIYTRRSTDRQAASPKTQETLCKQWLESNGHIFVRNYHEVAISGKTEIERRTALPELIAAIKDKKNRDFDAVVVWKTDRLCRNPAEWHRIMSIFDKAGCTLFSVMDPVKRDTASDRLISSIFADVAAYEREITGERIYAHHLSAFMKGEWPGGPKSLGLAWDKANKVFMADDRAEDVVTIFRTYITNNGNASKTARDLNIIGMPSPSGKMWSNGPLLHLLRNAMYRRVMTYDNRLIACPEKIPEIVPPELINQADKLLQWSRDEFVRFQRKPQGQPRAYSSLMYCSECGSVLTSNGSDHKDQRYYSGWLCAVRRKHGAAICDSHQISSSYVDALLAAALQMLLDSVTEDISQGLKAHRQSLKATRTRQNQLNKLMEAQRRTVDIYTGGYIAEGDFITRMDDIKTKIAALSDQEKHVAADHNISEAVLRSLQMMVGDWKDVSVEEKRGLLLQLGAKITLNTKDLSPLWLTLKTDISDKTFRAESFRVSRWGVKEILCCVM